MITVSKTVTVPYKRGATTNSVAAGGAKYIKGLEFCWVPYQLPYGHSDLFIRPVNSKGMISDRDYIRLSEPTPELLTELIEALAALRNQMLKSMSAATESENENAT